MRIKPKASAAWLDQSCSGPSPCPGYIPLLVVLAESYRPASVVASLNQIFENSLLADSMMRMLAALWHWLRRPWRTRKPHA